jgi:hypothetical protein
MHTFVYVYIHMYKNIHTHIHTHTYTHNHTHTHTHTHIHTHIHTHTYTHIYTHIHTHSHICTYSLYRTKTKIKHITHTYACMFYMFKIHVIISYTKYIGRISIFLHIYTVGYLLIWQPSNY